MVFVGLGRCGSEAFVVGRCWSEAFVVGMLF